MTIRAALAAALALAAAPALAQPAVEVTPLAAPDAFANGARDTGLPPDLWRGASVETARTVLPLLAARPLSPAAAALARRVLATGANGPEGAGQDRELAGARIAALIAQCDALDAYATTYQAEADAWDILQEERAMLLEMIDIHNNKCSYAADVLRIYRH